MRTAVGALVAGMVLAGCIEAELVPCGALACGRDAICTPGGCATLPEAAACRDLADGEPCSTPTIEVGSCQGGACREARCGNGVIELDERCDDGNQVYGDMCAGDCRSLETCGNAIFDIVAGEECDDGNANETDVCRANCTIPRCGDGVLDGFNGEGCDNGSANSIAPGAACRPNCQVSRCGDGIQDPAEVCDAGDLVSGDGCSADCRSLEVCGNQIVDTLAGEQCDSGVTGLSGDGCTSTCAIEFLTWRDVTPPGPPPRSEAGMVRAGNRVILFGGFDVRGLALGDTWEWDGRGWTPLNLSPSPAPRGGVSLAYDLTREKVVMFGGRNEAGVAGSETWELDATGWQQRTPSTVPPAREQAVLSFGPSGSVVMFGGKAGATFRSDTWLWNGVNWSPGVGTGPSGRYASAMAFHEVLGQIVLFGGRDAGGIRDDTWLWNGTWALATPSTKPPQRTWHGMTYIRSTDQLVMQGGFSGIGFQADAWLFDGVNWAPASAGPFRFLHMLAEDPLDAGAVLFGGSVGSAPLGETWGWDFNVWRELAPVQAPMGWGVLAYDAGRGITVAVTADALYEWDGIVWRRYPSAPSPYQYYSASLVYDSGRRAVLLLTNVGVWSWNGTTWSVVMDETQSPVSDRSEFAVAYDAGRDQIIVFGGTDGSSFGTTFKITGTTWTYLDAGPSPRWYTAMAYDPVRDRIVLFGGYDNVGGDSITEFGDTWEWNGTSWTQRSDDPLFTRYGHAMAYDPLLGGVVMMGGQRGPGDLDDAWLWNGTQWTKLPIVVATSTRTGIGLARDVRGSLIMAGGSHAGQTLRDTHRLRYESSQTPTETCASATTDADGDGLAGCADPNCFIFCTPLCVPNATGCATTAPYCGDGVCGAIESAALCPSDCP